MISQMYRVYDPEYKQYFKERSGPCSIWTASKDDAAVFVSLEAAQNGISRYYYKNRVEFIKDHTPCNEGSN